MTSISHWFLIVVSVIPAFLNWFINLESVDRKVLASSKRQKSFNIIKVSLRKAVASFILLCASIVSLLFYKYETLTSYRLTEQLFLILIFAWLISGLFTQKFIPMASNNIYYKIGPLIKSYILMVLIVGMVHFFQLNEISRGNIFGSLLIYSMSEFSVFSLVFIMRVSKSSAKKVINNISRENQSKLIKGKLNPSSSSIVPLLNQLKWFSDSTIIDYIVSSISKKGYIKDKTIIISTTEPGNFTSLNNNNLIVINMHRLNDVISINEMFCEIRKTLVPGGVFIGCVSTLGQDYYRLRNKMPRIVFSLFFPVHFMFYRIIPKLPVFHSIFILFTKGKKQILSKAEVFGRLSYCGFTIQDSSVINGKLFFTAQLDKTISSEQNPSQGPIIKLKRIGLNGKEICIYKLRTMHPYSEFIQKEVFEKNRLENTGKLKNDFRVTPWGKVLRKLWIDELPQLINWIRGDISIVGVRALSEHYFSLYPNDLQDLRTQFKPGLIPPYYADMPKSFDEIVDSERRYLLSKKEKPFTTDWKYFWKAFFNIVFRGARSG